MAEILTIVERSGLGIATIMARKGIAAATLEAALGVRMPVGPRKVDHEGLAFLGTGPDVWLAMTEMPGLDWPADLERRLEGLASISDQSGSYVIFRITGDDARALLQRGAYIDLHSGHFGAGSVATTVIAHIGVIFWHVDDRTFDIATFRSFAPNLLRWLTTTGAPL